MTAVVLVVIVVGCSAAVTILAPEAEPGDVLFFLESITVKVGLGVRHCGEDMWGKLGHFAFVL